VSDQPPSDPPPPTPEPPPVVDLDWEYEEKGIDFPAEER